MKSKLLTLLFCSCAVASQIAAQEKTAPQVVEPQQLHVIPNSSIRQVLSIRHQADSAASPANPFFPALPLCVVEGETIVGTCPDTGTSATVPAVIVPVILSITQGGTTFVFDPTAGDEDCIGAGNNALDLTVNSPLFSPAPFVINGEDEGTTQFVDAFTNAQFSAIKAPGYQVLLNPTIGPPLAISVDAGPAGNFTAAVFNLGGTQCGTNPDGINPPRKLGVLNINVMDARLRNYIADNGLDASQLPYFVTYNAVMSIGDASVIGNCCVLGFHEALGAPGQTYAIAEFEGRNQTVFRGASDTVAGSHEIGEWLDDPGVNNTVTPDWGNIGQVRGCVNILEVGDPLTGSLMPEVPMPNGFTYHLQELAFFSWFTRDDPSLGAGGLYSSNGSFGGFARPCPPGGTF